MKKSLLRYLLLIITAFSAFTVTEAKKAETLYYVVSYKWGLVRKDAGDATLTMTPRGDQTELVLTAKTRPWADRFYEVRDTLRSVTSGPNFLPLSYVKTAHEGGNYARDEIKFSRSGSAVTAKCNKLRIRKNGKRKSGTFQMKGTGEVFDMLSVFYYLRNVDYVSLQRGKPKTVTIFSGSDKSETVTIRFVKEETVEMKDKTRRKAFLLKLGFTSDGHKKSNDDIRVWVSADGAHIPLLLVGSLPVGEVRVRLV